MCYGKDGLAPRCFVDGLPADIEVLKAKVREAGIEAMYEHEPRQDPVFLRIVIGYPIPEYWDEHMRKDAACGRIPYTGPSDVLSLIEPVKEALQGVFFHDKRQIVRYEVRNQYGDIRDRKPWLYVMVAPLRLWKRLTSQTEV